VLQRCSTAVEGGARLAGSSAVYAFLYPNLMVGAAACCLQLQRCADLLPRCASTALPPLQLLRH
jgi:hypothetical protein